jgi:alkylhydroperoxidase/carboxymuconolactone decarboxylase family protein YurZ
LGQGSFDVRATHRPSSKQKPSTLSKRDHSLMTVAALVAGGNTEQLLGHLARARDKGVTETELVEAITHLAFYAGRLRAMSAIAVWRSRSSTADRPLQRAPRTGTSRRRRRWRS